MRIKNNTKIFFSKKCSFIVLNCVEKNQVSYTRFIRIV